MVKLGIDFGTTNTAVSYVDHSGIVRPILGGKIRSALYFYPDGDDLLYGKDALETSRYEDPTSEETGLVKDLKRKMKPEAGEYIFGKKMSYVQLIGTFLKKIKEDAETNVFHGEHINDVCITHPVDFKPDRIELLRQAAMEAGFKNVSTLYEPVAAAYGAMDSMQKKEGYVFHEENFLIFDFGGGTLDLAYVESSRDRITIPLQCVGDSHCGGEDIDNAFYKLFDDRFFSMNHQHISDNAGEIDVKFRTFFCEHNKEILSKLLKPESPMAKKPIQGVAKGKPIKIEVDYPLWLQLITPTLDKAMEAVDKMLAQVKANNKKIDRVILIGGSSSIPEVKTLLKERFNLDCYSFDEDRDVAVANGAAIRAHYGEMPRKCFCINCGHELLSNQRKCPECLTDNYFYDHAFDGQS